MSAKKSLYKVLMIGDSGVGKTSILIRYVRNEFFQAYKATIGADFMSREVNVDGQSVTLQIWDTAGQEKFLSLGPQFFRGADACIIVYDVSDQVSFSDVAVWRTRFIEQWGMKDPSQYPFFVIGNKIDLGPRVVPEEEAKKWCKDCGVQYFEASAKDSTNIENTFHNIATTLVSRATTETANYSGVDYSHVVRVAKKEDMGHRENESSSCC